MCLGACILLLIINDDDLICRSSLKAQSAKNTPWNCSAGYSGAKSAKFRGDFCFQADGRAPANPGQANNNCFIVSWFTVSVVEMRSRGSPNFVNIWFFISSRNCWASFFLWKCHPSVTVRHSLQWFYCTCHCSDFNESINNGKSGLCCTRWLEDGCQHIETSFCKCLWQVSSFMTDGFAIKIFDRKPVTSNRFSLQFLHFLLVNLYNTSQSSITCCPRTIIIRDSTSWVVIGAISLLIYCK